MRSIYFFGLLLLMLFSCKPSGEHRTSKGIKTKSISISHPFFNFTTHFTYTKNIRVENHGSYQIIYLLNPWLEGQKWVSYILYPKNTKQDSLWPEVDYKIPVPVSRIALSSASNIGFLEALHSLKNVVAVSKKNYVYNSFIRQGIDKHKIAQLGGNEQLNIEQLLASNPSVFIQTPYSSDRSKDNIITKAGIPVVYNADWLENNPLGRAEWIKIIGLIVHKEREADSLFSTIAKRYNTLKLKAQTFADKKDVLVGGLYKDVWYMPAGKSYKALLIHDAGSNYHWSNTEGTASLALSLESVIKYQFNADFWIEAPALSLQNLLKANSKYMDFEAFKKKQVYNNMKQVRADGANNYWEEGVCRPDLILADLISIFHHKQYPEGCLFYSKLSDPSYTTKE